MHPIYSFAVNQLQNYSRSLTKKALFVDKSWALIDADSEIQKLIFKKNNELIISKNGNVKLGKWEYLSEAKSLLIDRGSDIILCNEGFVDESALVLKKDGTQNQYFVLANENKIPDLDVESYLMNLRNQELRIIHKELVDGRTLQIQPLNVQLNPGGGQGDIVMDDFNDVQDGTYNIKNTNEIFLIRNSKIEKILYLTSYPTSLGTDIIIEQENQYYYRKGDAVTLHGRMAPDGKYKIKGSSNIRVKDGIIVKKAWL